MNERRTINENKKQNWKDDAEYIRLPFWNAMGRSSVAEVPGNCAVTVSLDFCAGFGTESGASTWTRVSSSIDMNLILKSKWIFTSHIFRYWPATIEYCLPIEQVIIVILWRRKRYENFRFRLKKITSANKIYRPMDEQKYLQLFWVLE